MNTKYGNLPDESLVVYVNSMISKVYRMLPMKEENVSTIDTYISSTLREFIGQKELIDKFKDDKNLFAILGVLEHLLQEDDISNFKSDIFKVINLIEKMKLSLDGEK